MTAKTISDFVSLLDDYLLYLKSLNYSIYTTKIIRCYGRTFLKYLSSKHSVLVPAELQRVHLTSWQKFIAAQTTPKGFLLKASTLNKKIEVVRGFIRYLANHGYLQKVMVEMIRYVKTPQFLPCGILTDTEMRELFKKIDITTNEGIQDRAILELMYSSGLRAGEVVKLHTRSIDFDNGVARVFGKGSKERIVPVGETALMWLEKYLKSIRPFMIKSNVKTNDGTTSLFVNSSGTQLQYHTLLRMVHKHTAKTDFKEHVTPHTFRRSCTTELIRGEANLYHVKDILGHESLDTLKHYTKLNITDLKRTHGKSHPRA